MAKLDKSQVIAISLVVALAFNAVVHATSPAYRYYRENFQLVESSLEMKFKEHCHNIETNVISICSVFTTNILNFASSLSHSSPSPGKSSDSTSVKLDTPILPEVDVLAYDYASVDGFPLAVIGGQYFKCGDIFPRGGVISSISCDCLILDGRYRVTNKKGQKNGD